MSRGVGAVCHVVIVDINSVSYSNLYKVQGQVVSQDVLDDITEGGEGYHGGGVGFQTVP